MVEDPFTEESTVIFPWLQDSLIDTKALLLLESVFGGRLDRAAPLDLEGIVAFLSESDGLSYNDDADLGMEAGEFVLGKTQPVKRRILIARSLRFDPEPGRARFTLAHELGHWVLHRPLFVAHSEELSLFDNPAEDDFEFVGINRSIFPDGHAGAVRREEWQANRFAVALLIDRDVLRAEFVRRFGEALVARTAPGWRLRSARLRDHSRLLGSCETNGQHPLRDVFGLSTEAMAIALESRGYAVEVEPIV